MEFQVRVRLIKITTKKGRKIVNAANENALFGTAVIRLLSKNKTLLTSEHL